MAIIKTKQKIYFRFRNETEIIERWVEWEEEVKDGKSQVPTMTSTWNNSKPKELIVIY